MTTTKGAPCAVCRREAGAVVVQLRGHPFVPLCSPGCAHDYLAGRVATDSEREAALAGGAEAGAYLDGLGRTDLARLSAEEWAEFCARLFLGACADLRERADDMIPF